MNIQVLLSTMGQKDLSILEKMNIKTDAIVVNQSKRNEFATLSYNGNKIKYISLNERGVGLSRNTALMRADSDICLFSDDDVVLYDNYNNIIREAFIKNKQADIIIFNLKSNSEKRGQRSFIKENKRLHLYNGLRFGAPQIAIKLDSIRKANVYFSLLFGGGTSYSSGEDTLFLADCFRKGLKIYASKEVIGTISFDESTWFNGYNEKYFIDKGIFYGYLNKPFARLFSLRFALKHKKIFESEISWQNAYRLMVKGINSL